LLKAIKKFLQPQLLFFEGLFDKPFGPDWNPLRQLGTLSFFFYWVVAVSGIYVYIAFETTVDRVYPSIEYMTHQQWYLGGIMRSLHRYASDAMVVTTVLHVIREFVTDRYRGVRWFTWFTGVPILWFLYASGVSGYWLVWDQLAQYVAIGSMEWIDWLGFFSQSVANNFLTVGSLTDRFFTLLIFMHIAIPLFLLFIMWIHLLKLNRPKVNPPRGLAVGCLLMLVGLSLAYPATSHPEADLATVPHSLNMDWFYLVFYPWFDAWGSGALWALGGAISLFVALMPWMPPLKRPPAAVVTAEQCNGCARCFADCPFAAVTMKPRTDGRPYPTIAAVDPKFCTGCGLCVGACPTSTPFRSADELVTGIDLPNRRLNELYLATEKAVALARETTPPGEPAVVVYGCEHGSDVTAVGGPGIGTIGLPCIGNLPPSFIDYLLSRAGVDGIMLTGCREGDCYHRLGIRWTRERVDGERDPYLRDRVPRRRMRAVWVAPTEGRRLAEELAAFRGHLKTLGHEANGNGATEAATAPAPAAE
jgi:ferredoxin/coenzyme F420-reducing hydrogenase delta subunit